MACYLGKAKNPIAATIGMLEPFTHKFWGKHQKFVYRGLPQDTLSGLLTAGLGNLWEAT
jgi:hypothetical protein